MTAVETSAVTWGGTELSYTIRRSPRRKKTVAVTVDPTGGILVVAPERVATERLDSIVGRKAEWIVRRIRRAGAHGARFRRASSSAARACSIWAGTTG